MDIKQVAIAFAAFVGLTVIGALGFMYSGIYNVAADQEVGNFKRWVLHTTMERSVESRLDGIEVPELDTRKNLVTGAGHYDQMCAGCHGAPGAEPGEIAEGLNPRPPELTKIDADEDPAELFWVTKHGIEMTGMPAWGTTHDDASIWAMVALMKQFPEMSAEEYEELVETAKSDSHHHKEGAHDHGSHGH